MKINIRLKLIGPLILIVAVAVVMIGFGYFELRSLHGVEEENARLFYEFDAVTRIDAALAEQDAPVHDFLINGNRAEKIAYVRLAAITDQDIERVEKNFVLNAKEQKLLSRVKNLQKEIKTNAETIFALPDPIGNKTGNQLMKDLDSERTEALAQLAVHHNIDRGEIGAARLKANDVRASENYFIAGLLLIAVVALLFIYLVTLYVYRPLLELHQGVDEMTQGNLGVLIQLKTRDELQDLADAFNMMAFNINQEQQTAAKIQRRLLPQKHPKIQGVRLHARQALAKVVGGDWYDYYRLQDELFILIADASGKGMPGALLSTVTMSAMRSEPKTEIPLIELLRKTNQTVVNRLSAGDFVTLFIAQLNLKTHVLSFVNCGQEPPLIFEPEKALWSDLKTNSGLPIGISDKLFNPKLESIKIGKGCRILLYTDGLHDIRNPRGDFFTVERATDWLNRNQQMPIKPLIDGLLQEALEFGDSHILDDITMLGMEIVK